MRRTSRRRRVTMRIVMRVFWGSLLCGLCCFITGGLVPTPVLAGTYYVSSSGTGTWAQATNVATPTNAGTAFNSAVAGDVVYFRGGTYNVPAKTFGDTYQGYYQPANSGTSASPITFQAYPGEVPLFNGTTGGSGDGTYYATIMGVYLKSYVIFDGFHFQANGGTGMARFHVGSDGEYSPPHTTTNVTIQNCAFNGGNTISSTDNYEGVRVDSAGYVTIANNVLFNYVEATGYHNTSAIKEYNVDHLVIRNNEIRNNTLGVYLKRDCEACTLAYNFIHDNNGSGGVLITPYNAGTEFDMPNLVIHDNVVVNNVSGIGIYTDHGELAYADNALIYNNTFYGPSASGAPLLMLRQGRNAKVYNNILQLQVGSPQIDFGDTAFFSLQTSDYNQFGNNGFGVQANTYGSGGTKNYASLTSWRSSGALSGGGSPDVHSLASNPVFVNASGKLNVLADFALAATSPCKGAGQGGVDMGANISLVGASGTGTGLPTPTNLHAR
jgi:hypothetical protein